MCGIAGVFSYRGEVPVDLTGLGAMADAMARRGPDGQGFWTDETAGIGLAHRRLSIIDLKGGAQPMTSRDGRRVIVFNGEIYNYQALRDDLIAQGRPFKSDSDTEVLLQLYDRDGPAMLGRLRGMFAFAIYDRTKDGVFLARDGFGIKPLYYADDGRTVRFASQVKALLAGGGIDRRPSAAGQAGFFLWGSVPEPWTLFDGIRALPAGHSLWIGRNGPGRPSAFFDPVAELAQAERVPSSSTTAELREALLDTVRHHLVADVPVGAFLSAGLDSATLVALASELREQPLRSVTLAFDEFGGTAADEAPLAEEVARAYSTDHQTRRVRGSDFHADYDRLLAAMDQPSVDGVNTYFVSKATVASGLKVALSGLGGDELFAGYDGFREIPWLVGLASPFRSAPALGRGFRRIAAPVLRQFTSPKYASLFEYGTSYGDAYLLRRSLFLPWELPEVMDPEMAAAGWQQLEAESPLRREVDKLKAPRLKITALETNLYMRNQLLRDADWAGMAHSLEIRVPLVDTFLFKTLAPVLVSSRPPSKLDMARTPSRPLPEAILARRKTGFSVPVQEWMSGSRGAGGQDARAWAKRVMADCYR